MTSTLDSSDQLNHVDDQDNETVSLPSIKSSNDCIPEEKTEEPVVASLLEETDIPPGDLVDGIPDGDESHPSMNSTNTITAEASFTEATATDLPSGAPRSSIARILVKPGQIFRVQVDNEVKEVHGKLVSIH